MNYDRIKETIKEKEIPFMHLCKQVGLTSAGLNKMLANKKMNINVLEDISRVIDVPMHYWFRNDAEQSIRELKTRIDELEEENKNLKDLTTYQREEIKSLSVKL